MIRGGHRDASTAPVRERKATWLLKAECDCGCTYRVAWKWCGDQLRCPVPLCNGQITLQLQRKV